MYLLFFRLLGKFEEASHDLCESLKIDYDDQTNEWLSEVKPNAEKLRQHKLSEQRKKEERDVSKLCNVKTYVYKYSCLIYFYLVYLLLYNT